MYIPAHFASDDPATIAEIVRNHSFATLVTTAEDGTPFASHCPLLYDAAAGPRGTFHGHLARANPHWQQFERAADSLAIFHGPHAYVSPSWYGQHPSVPTWNFVAVHAYGRPALLDPGRARETLARLVAAYEAADSGWSMAALPASYTDGMIRGIVAFEIPVARFEAKLKLSQNRSPEDRRAVIDRLGASAEAADRDTSAAMRRWSGSD